MTMLQLTFLDMGHLRQDLFFDMLLQAQRVAAHHHELSARRMFTKICNNSP